MAFQAIKRNRVRTTIGDRYNYTVDFVSPTAAYTRVLTCVDDDEFRRQCRNEVTRLNVADASVDGIPADVEVDLTPPTVDPLGALQSAQAFALAAQSQAQRLVDATAVGKDADALAAAQKQLASADTALAVAIKALDAAGEIVAG